jgi:predicted TIM-barrel fold metal-dependent hydrolase
MLAPAASSGTPGGTDQGDQHMGMPTDIGIVDLGMGFPYTSVEDKKAAYGFFKANLKDRESLEEMEFPAQYMFKDVPDVVPPDTDVVAWIVEKMDAFNIEQCMTGVNDRSIEAKERNPGRFHLCASADPNQGMDTVRKLKQLKRDHNIVSAMTFPSGMVPQVGIGDKKMYPIYAACCELDIPICINGGIVGPRMPSWPQHVEQFDEVLYDFPELTMVMMHGGEPWTALAVKLMLKWPGLHYMTSAFAPKHYPKDIIAYANTRGADKIMFCGYFPAGLTLERQFAELPNVPFHDDVWPKFLRTNAQRVFHLPT